MIRFRLKELIAEREFQTDKRVTFDEISEATGIHRTTLSRIANTLGYNTTTDHLDRLCEFFGCELGQLAERVERPKRTKKSK